MQVSSSNMAETVLKLFLNIIKRFGCPSRVRGDRGAENVDLCTWMIMYRGPNRASFMWGTYVFCIWISVCGSQITHVCRSTHNTRIERLWLESGRHFARGWRAFFTRLERLHFLDRSDPHHLWLLHILFLDDVSKDCDDFCTGWNTHPISGKGENMNPLVRITTVSNYV